jgi:hypothetical protein
MITDNINLINKVAIVNPLTNFYKALEKAENVVLVKKGDAIELVKPKRDQLKISIRISGVEPKDSEELKTHVYSLVSNTDDVKLPDIMNIRLQAGI